MKQNHSLSMAMDAQRITSREIANITGKPHKDVLKAIRAMEPAWEKECGRKFSLTSEMIRMPQGGVRMIPVFSLTKTESLFVATKFNDEARARLVLRWEQLEFEQAIDEHRSLNCCLRPSTTFCNAAMRFAKSRLPRRTPQRMVA